MNSKDRKSIDIVDFPGTGREPLRTKVWVAISTYMLIIMAKTKFQLSQSLYEILQLISLFEFDRTPVNQLFSYEEI